MASAGLKGFRRNLVLRSSLRCWLQIFRLQIGVQQFLKPHSTCFRQTLRSLLLHPKNKCRQKRRKHYQTEVFNPMNPEPAEVEPLTGRPHRRWRTVLWANCDIWGFQTGLIRKNHPYGDYTEITVPGGRSPFRLRRAGLSLLRPSGQLERCCK